MLIALGGESDTWQNQLCGKAVSGDFTWQLLVSPDTGLESGVLRSGVLGRSMV